MIKLEFMDECEDCPHLEETTDTIELTSWGEYHRYVHTISCAHMKKCKMIKEHLRKEMQKNGK